MFVFLVLITVIQNSSAKNFTIHKIKTLQITSGDDLCDRQFKRFVESLKTGERWASDSK